MISKPKRNNYNPTSKIVILLTLTVVLFFSLNVAMRYLLTFLQSAKNIENKIPNPADMYDFKIRYLVIPPDNLDLPVILLGSFALALFFTYKIDGYLQRRNANKNIDGDARWITNKELNKTLIPVSKNNIKNADVSGIVLADFKNNFYVDTDTIHSLIIGTTRSGKGQTFVLPMIRMLSSGKRKQNMIINDPKGEITENTYGILRRNGYKIYILNLVDTNKSHLWNPLQVIIDEYIKAQEGKGDLSKATKLINSLSATFCEDSTSRERFWSLSAQSLLSAMILYLLDVGYKNNSLDKLNMYSVYSFFLEYGSKNERIVDNKTKTFYEENALDKLFQKLPVGHPAKLAYATSTFASGDTRGSIFSILASNLQIFGSDVGISKLTAGNDIDFSFLTDEKVPCAVFMVVPDEDSSRHILASLFVNQCYSSLIEQSRKYPQQQLPRRVQFILDEFGNMTRIPEMDIKITISLGRNILFNLFVQDLNQLDMKYGKSAKTIRSNCGNIIYINSIDNDTNEYISRLLGNETVEYRSYSGKLNEFLNSQNINVKGRRLLTATELSVLEMGETVVKRQRCYPIFTKFTPWYKLGLPIIPLDKIRIKFKEIKLEEILFPFSLIGKEVEVKAEALREQSPVEEIEESILDDYDFDDEFEEVEYDPYSAILDKVTHLTGGEFDIYSREGKYSACRRLVNTLKFKKKIDEKEYHTMIEFIKLVQEEK